MNSFSAASVNDAGEGCGVARRGARRGVPLSSDLACRSMWAACTQLLHPTPPRPRPRPPPPPPPLAPPPPPPLTADLLESIISGNQTAAAPQPQHRRSSNGGWPDPGAGQLAGSHYGSVAGSLHGGSSQGAGGGGWFGGFGGAGGGGDEGQLMALAAKQAQRDEELGALR
jgi:hypothetical protein